jgi:hypothetical protein
MTGYHRLLESLTEGSSLRFNGALVALGRGDCPLGRAIKAFSALNAGDHIASDFDIVILGIFVSSNVSSR